MKKYFIPLLFLAPSFCGCLSSSSVEDFRAGLGTPQLSFQAPQTDLFGTVTIGTASEATLTIRNTGSGDATEMDGSLSSPLF